MIQNNTEYKKEYQDSVENPELFWSKEAEHFTWRKKWDKELNWSFDPFEVKWFAGGQLNITENCLDRHLDTIGNKTAINWEPNDPNETGVKLTDRKSVV